VIDKISHNFVPIAVNLYTIRDAKDAAGELFRGARNQKNQYQGFWIVTPDGKLLSSHQDHSEKRWTEEVLATIATALDKAGTITRREPEPKDVLPLWGKGMQKDGSVTLAISTRYIHGGKGIGNGALDAVTFTAKEWKKFAPPEAVKGKKWDLPANECKEFCRCLSTVSDKGSMPIPAEVTEADFTGTVTRVKDGIATISYSGRIAALHTHPFNKRYVNTVKATVRGLGSYDVEKKEMVSLLWVLEGATRNISPPETTANPLGAVIEWKRDTKLAKAARR
jgi:hypothetical protein